MVRNLLDNIGIVGVMQWESILASFIQNIPYLGYVS
jgi:hypothetical protein